VWNVGQVVVPIPVIRSVPYSDTNYIKANAVEDGIGPDVDQRTRGRGETLNNIEALPPHLLARQKEIALDHLGRLHPSHADDRDDWLRVGMALHSIDPDDDGLLVAWVEFSEQSESFSEGECEKQWGSFKSGGGITVASLVKMARDDEAAGRSLATQTMIASKPTADVDLSTFPPPLPASFLKNLNSRLKAGYARPAKATPLTKPPASKPPRTLDDIVAATGKQIGGVEVARWLYHDASAKEVLVVVRYQLADGSKSYRQFSKFDTGWKAKGIEKNCPLYRLPEILRAGKDELIVLCEGEKTADAARGLGYVATTSCQGAHSPGKTDFGPLTGHNVVIFPDNDESGEGYRAKLLGLLSQHSPLPIVRVVPLPGLPDKGDFYDFVEARAGKSKEEIRAEVDALIAATKPVELIGPEGMLEVVCAANIQPEPLVWLWPGRIPGNKLTLIVGEPGEGKSLVTLDLAARISSGRELPGDVDHNPALPGDIILMSFEDDDADTTVPRLMAAGADLNRVHIIKTVKLKDAKTGKIKQDVFKVERDLSKLDAHIRQTPGCKAVIIDPVLVASGKSDANNASEVYSLLAPLNMLAATHKIAVIGVAHFNKDANRSARHRVNGSISWIGAARAVLALVREPRDVDRNRRLFLPVKSNNSGDTHGLELWIEPSDIPDVVLLRWGTVPVDRPIDQILQPEHREPSAPKRDAASEFLRKLLSDAPMRSKDVFAEADRAGIKPDTLREAAKSLGIQRTHENPTLPWLWALPAAVDPGE